jgi:acetate kinase
VTSRHGRPVLALNAGSSSLKFSLFSMLEGGERILAEGAVENIGQGNGRAVLRRGDARHEIRAACPDYTSALERVFQMMKEPGESPELVGHRIVHGGETYSAPVRIDAELVDGLRGLLPLAPLHIPAAIAGIDAMSKRLPHIPQVACFDTHFHGSLPAVARRFAIPARLHDDGIRRFGFHGLSYESVMSALGPEAPARIVIAHLGSGASLAAVKDGVSIDTTMGFTPDGGIPMGTRSGDLDPGILLYLLREKRYSSAALEQLLEQESGLRGIAGASDMEHLLSVAPREERAELAIQVFAYGIKKAIGGYVAALGGLDLLVFTGGIGEHAARVRSLACDGLLPLGVLLDESANAAHAPVISARNGPCAVRIVPADENRMVARHTLAVAGVV